MRVPFGNARRHLCEVVVCRRRTSFCYADAHVLFEISVPLGLNVSQVLCMKPICRNSGMQFPFLCNRALGEC